MALYNQVLVDRFNRALVKLLKIKVPGGNAVDSLTPELAATLELGNMPDEYRAIAGEHYYAANISTAGVAAQFTTVGLRNPVVSTKLVFGKIRYCPTGNQILSTICSVAGEPVGLVASSKRHLDSRWSLQLGTIDNAAGDVGTAVPLVATLAAQPANPTFANFNSPIGVGLIEVKFILAPGSTFITWVSVANVALFGDIEYFEREVESTELNV